MRETGAASGDRFRDKVAIITGGASGIGRGVAERLVAEGARVVVGDVDEAGLRALAGELGAACVVTACDVTTEEGPEALAALAVERFGQLDIAVANAGGGTGAAIVDLELAEWQRVLDLTLTGCFLTVRAAARVLADGGAIVAISSLSAVQPGRRVGAYGAAKAGVIALADAAALELGPRGIRVNVVAPGLVRTPATEMLWSVPGMVDAYLENTALARHAVPGDIAAAVAFLASEDAALITGTTLFVDAGAHHLSYPDTAKARARAAEAG